MRHGRAARWYLMDACALWSTSLPGPRFSRRQPLPFCGAGVMMLLYSRTQVVYSVTYLSVIPLQT